VLAKKPAAEVPSAVGAALSIALADKGKTITVLMPYADKLAWLKAAKLLRPFSVN